VPVVREAFERLSVGTTEFLRGERSGKLTVSMSPNFAAKWMVHRLGRFAERHPDLDLRLSPSMHRVDFLREDVDMAIRHGDGRWPELHVTRLCVEEFFPVCSPRFLERSPGIRHPSDLRHVTLLHDSGWRNWPEWLAAAGAEGVDAARGPSFDFLSNAIDAAVQGQGVALARTALAMQDLLQGRLIRLFDVALPAPFGYFIVCPLAMAAKRKVTLFRDWLLAEAAADAEDLIRLNPRAP
jgi:LysR family glycine cleavage system transcriptional activator